MGSTLLYSGFETCFGTSTHHTGIYCPYHGSFLWERVVWGPHGANTGIGSDFFMLDAGVYPPFPYLYTSSMALVSNKG